MEGVSGDLVGFSIPVTDYPERYGQNGTMEFQTNQWSVNPLLPVGYGTDGRAGYPGKNQNAVPDYPSGLDTYTSRFPAEVSVAEPVLLSSRNGADSELQRGPESS